MELPLVSSWVTAVRNVHSIPQKALEPLCCKGFKVANDAPTEK